MCNCTLRISANKENRNERIKKRKKGRIPKLNMHNAVCAKAEVMEALLKHLNEDHATTSECSKKAQRGCNMIIARG